ncbi:uncharacterized protein LOC143885138 [Tasmannia lanceolata]|uniref:uncharacterized protein LOC143885138 n=1 Tax=Tasmannia lanceolata TaxID=3420 RepID=UPI004064AC7A
MKVDVRSGNPKVEKDRASTGALGFVKRGGAGTIMQTLGSDTKLVQNRGFASHGSSGKLKVYELKKEKKRKLLISDSESDDFVSTSGKVGYEADRHRNGFDSKKTRLDPIRYLEDKNGNGSVDSKKKRVGSLEVKDGFEIDGKKTRLDPIRYLEGGETRRKKIRVAGTERESSGDDPFAFREDAIIDRKKIKMESLERQRSSDNSLKYREGVEIKRGKMKVELWNSGEVNAGNKAAFRGTKLMVPTVIQREGERKFSRSNAIDERPESHIHSSGSVVVERNKRFDQFDKKRLRLEKGENFRSSGPPGERFTVPRGEGIRLQGKGGVLKLLPNNKMKVGAFEKTYGRRGAEENRRNHGISSFAHQNMLVGTPLSRGKKSRESSDSSAMRVKNCLNMRKSSSTEKFETCDLQTEEDDISLQIELNNMDTRGTKKGVESKGESFLASEIIPPTKRKEMGWKSGRSTEKQQLRDRIKSMLLNAGWKIENRPRRNRNYLDAVYISPKGTAYWSVLNAYHALRKELNCENWSDDCLSDNPEDKKLPGTFTGVDHELNGPTSPFSVIPADVLSILTRRTKKKKVKQERDKKLEDGRVIKNEEVTKIKFINNKHVKGNAGSSKNKEKLNSFTASDGKLSKGTMKENGSVGLKTKGAVRSLKSNHLSDKVGYTNGELLLSGKDSSTSIMLKPPRAQNSSLTSDADFLLGRKKKKRRGYALLVRGSNKWASLDTDDFKPYAGKRTVLSWLIDSGTVPENGKVRYMNKKHTRAMLEGWIRRDGIHCSCCSKILTISKFEIHAGSKIHQPFQNIFIQTGISLLQCQLDAWDKQEESERRGLHFIDMVGDDPNDDTCGICGDGGDLICCDSCPSTFHQSCLNIQMLPPGDWHCPNCSCRFCGVVDNSNSQGDSVTVTPRLSCSQCERKYHQQCVRETNFITVDANSPCTSFCGKNCRKIFERLEKLLGVKHDLEMGFSWTIIKRLDQVSRTSLRALAQRAECNSKLAVALAVMDECFLPIIDQRSGINLIHNVVYNCGSNFNRLNYSGFYTIILERGDEIISAASIRIHGTRLAEMPFIGTRDIYRRQGMCRRLLNAIELVLCSLNVEKLIIPAISELMHTWTIVFGFKPLEESHTKEMRSMNMLVFPGTDLLQKQLRKREYSKGNTTADTVMEAVEVEGSHLDRPEVANTSLAASSLGSDVDVSEEGTVHVKNEINETKDIVAAGDPCPHAHNGSTYNISEVPRPLDASHGSNSQTAAEGTVCHNSESQYMVPVSSITRAVEVEVEGGHLDRPEVANTSPVASSLGFEVDVSEESTVHVTNETKDIVAAGDPGPHAHNGSTYNISEVPKPLDASHVSNFQTPFEGSEGYNSDSQYKVPVSSIMKAIEVESGNLDRPEMANTSLVASSLGSEVHVSEEGMVHLTNETKDIVAAGNPGSHAHNGSTYNISEVPKSLDASHGSIFQTANSESQYKVPVSSIMKAVEVEGSHLDRPEVANTSLLASSLESQVDVSEEGMVHLTNETNEAKDIVPAGDPGPHAHNGSTYNISEVPRPLDASHGSNFQTTAEGSVCYNSDSQYKVPVSSITKAVEVRFEVEGRHLDRLEVANTSLAASSLGSEVQVFEEGMVHVTNETNDTKDVAAGDITNESKDNVSACNSGPHTHNGSTYIISEVPRPLDASHGSNFQTAAEGSVVYNSESQYKVPSPAVSSLGFEVHVSEEGMAHVTNETKDIVAAGDPGPHAHNGSAYNISELLRPLDGSDGSNFQTAAEGSVCYNSDSQYKVTVSSIMKVVKVEGGHLDRPEVADTSPAAPSLGSEVHVSEEGMVHATNETKGIVAFGDPGPHTHNGTTYNISEVPRPLDGSDGSNFQSAAEGSICYNSNSQYKVTVSSTTSLHDITDVENQSFVYSPIIPNLQPSD